MQVFIRPLEKQIYRISESNFHGILADLQHPHRTLVF